MKTLGFACVCVAALATACTDQRMGARDVAAERPGERAVETQVHASGGSDESSYAPTIRIASPIEEGRTQRIGADLSPPAPARPPARAKIDVDLKAAPLGDALRFIADAGGFNLVVQGEPTTAITVKLRQVDAFDALLTVAEAQGLEVDFQRGIVVVGAPKSPAMRRLAADDIQ